MTEREELNKITEGIIGAAIEVHRNLGPGLLESAYQTALAYELDQRGYKVEQQKPLPMQYKEIKLDAGYLLDFLINEKVIVEIKSSDKRQNNSHSRCTDSFLSKAFWLQSWIINQFQCQVIETGYKALR